MMDFRLGDDTEELRAELRGYLEEALTDDVEERLYRSGVSHDPRFIQGLIDRGWFAPAWSKELGGAGLDPTSVMVIFEELNRREAPMYATSVSLMVAKALVKFGTDEMRRDIVPSVLRAETICVLGFTEPEAGSDVANAQTRSVRDGEEWIVNGSKMFTTNAQIGDYVYLLTRSNVDVPKHKGLTTFLVPLDHPGIEVQAVHTISGERTNIVYFNDVRVPDSARIGDVDAGWNVLTASLMDEQTASFAPWIVRLLEEVEAWAADAGRIDDPAVRERLGRVAAQAEVALLLRRRCTWMDEEGIARNVEGPMAKLFSSEALTHASQDMFDLIGPDALRSYPDPSAVRGGRIEYLMRFALGTTIYAGTSEIQRTQIAQRGLGLPR
jgi:alkylation response protein AidB-like acyl-CoA dehydrogenase